MQSLPIKFIRAAFVIPLLCIGLFLIDGYRFSYQYPPVSSIELWNKRPDVVNLALKNDTRIGEIGASVFWNSYFLTDGWKSLMPYSYSTALLYPNSGALYDIRQSQLNMGGLIPRRTKLFTDILGLPISESDDKETTLSATLINAFSLSSTEYITSPFLITNDDLLPVTTITPPKEINSDKTITVYKNSSALPRFFISYKTEKIDTIEDFYRNMNDRNFLQQKKVMTEETFGEYNSGKEGGESITVKDEKPTDIRLSASLPRNGLLVFTDTNYPGWSAELDNQSIPVHTVNLYQMAVEIPEGNHTVRFFFTSRAFELGKLITILTAVITASGVFLLCVRSRGTDPRTP
jgi:hypothetical protein